jgi:hypothetical protein
VPGIPTPIQEAFERAQELRNQNMPAPAPGVEEIEEVEQQPEPMPEPEPVSEPQEEDWKKRFIGYKQSTDNTIHELRTLLAQREADRATQQYELEQVQREVEQLRQTVPKGYVPDGVLSQEDIEILGEENAQRMAKLAEAYANKIRQEYESKLSAVTRKVNEREQQEFQQSQIRSDQEYWDRVKKMVPDAAEIDVESRFSEFLNSVEPSSGKTWRDLGASAKKAWDVSRMADIYSAYKKSVEPKSRENEVVPRGAGHTNAPAQTLTGAKIWTRKEYEQAVQRTIRGGPPSPEKMQAVDKLHAEFVQALREGRVR